MVASATAEQGVLGSNSGSHKVLLGFSIRDFSVTVTESGFVARLMAIEYTWDLKTKLAKCERTV